MKHLRQRRSASRSTSSPWPASTCAPLPADGWGKEDIRQFVFDNTQNIDRASQAHQPHPGRDQPGDETKMRPMVAEPDDILVVAAGGRAGAFSSFIPGWGGGRTSVAGSTPSSPRRSGQR